VKKQITEKGELIMKQQKLASLPKALSKIRFDQIFILDIRGNEITSIDETICLNVCQLRRLDARGNKIKEVSPHIKAMMMLQFLRLDSNLLEDLP
jgi:Leucine-rich repeat (LRR) protein